MMDIMYNLPSKEDVKEFTVTADMIKKGNDSTAELIKLPSKNEDKVIEPVSRLKSTEEIV
ncbi:MAG: hypothetical protein LUH05_05530 [Candidatus Gastranaerophilales bacterium]|nr:hypothetical protein [Candidatus Gastranaerophilales bacterium]